MKMGNNYCVPGKIFFHYLGDTWSYQSSFEGKLCIIKPDKLPVCNVEVLLSHQHTIPVSSPLESPHLWCRLYLDHPDHPEWRSWQSTLYLDCVVSHSHNYFDTTLSLLFNKNTIFMIMFYCTFSLTTFSVTLKHLRHCCSTRIVTPLS